MHIQNQIRQFGQARTVSFIKGHFRGRPSDLYCKEMRLNLPEKGSVLTRTKWGSRTPNPTSPRLSYLLPTWSVGKVESRYTGGWDHSIHLRPHCCPGKTLAGTPITDCVLPPVSDLQVALGKSQQQTRHTAEEDTSAICLELA